MINQRFKILEKIPEIVTVDQIINITECSDKKIKIGVTTGCFDIFHSGHLKSIKFAYKNCDMLILFLNSDNSIKKLKGDSRPINKLEYRLGLLEELPFIDFIVVFDEKNIDPILEKINFHLFFKGGDYNNSTKLTNIQEKNPNIKIILSEHISGNSTSDIIKRSII